MTKEKIILFLAVALATGCTANPPPPMTPQDEEKARLLNRLDEIAARLIANGKMENTGTPEQKRNKVRALIAQSDAKFQAEEAVRGQKYRDETQQIQLDAIQRELRRQK